MDHPRIRGMPSGNPRAVFARGASRRPDGGVGQSCEARLASNCPPMLRRLLIRSAPRSLAPASCSRAPLGSRNASATMNVDSSMRHHSTPIAVAAPRRGRHSRMSALRSLLTCTATLGLVGCPSGEDGLEPIVTSNTTFAPVQAGDALQAAEVERIIASAALAIDAPFMSVAVVDRIGNWSALEPEPRLRRRRPGQQHRRVARAHGRLPVPQPGAADEPHRPVHQHVSLPVSLRRGSLPARVRPATRAAAADQRRQQHTSGTAVADRCIEPRRRLRDPRSAVPRQSRRDGASPGFTALPGAIPLYKTTAAAIADPAVATLVGAAWAAWAST